MPADAVQSPAVGVGDMNAVASGPFCGRQFERTLGGTVVCFVECRFQVCINPT